MEELVEMEMAEEEVDPGPFVAGSCRICSPVIPWHVWTGNQGGGWPFLPFNMDNFKREFCKQQNNFGLIWILIFFKKDLLKEQ